MAAVVTGCSGAGTASVAASGPSASPSSDGAATSTPATTAPATTVSGSATTSGTSGGTRAAKSLSPDLSAALATMPATTTQSRFTDDAVMKKRWGVPDVTSATPTTSTQFLLYANHARSANVNPLALDAADARGAGWGGLDVDWSITSMVAGQPPAAVYGMRAGLDMSAVAAGLTAEGFTRSGPDSRPVFTASPANATGPLTFFSAVLVPDRHLLVTGADTSIVLAAIDGKTPTLATDPATDVLLTGTPAPEFLALSSRNAACVHPTGPVTGLSGTHPPNEIAAMTLDDHQAVVSLEFADGAAATADAPTRAALMTKGRSAVSQQSYTSIFTVGSTEVTGAVVSYHLTVEGHPSVLGSMVTAMDTPWAFCS